MVEERYSRNAAALFFLFSQSVSVAPSGFHWSCFHWPVVPRKLSRYSSLVPSSGSSFIPWRQYQLSIDLQKRWKSSNCSVVYQSNVGGFSASVGAPGLRTFKASAMAVSGSGSDMTWDKEITVCLMPLLQSQCMCNVPIAWYSSGLFHGAVGFWGPGLSREHTLGCVQSLGGMKSKGNTHQNSCIVQCPTFLCFLSGNPPVYQLFQSLAPSKWVLYTYRLPPCNNNMV